MTSAELRNKSAISNANVGDQVWITGFQIATGGKGHRVLVNVAPTLIKIVSFRKGYSSPIAPTNSSLYQVDSLEKLSESNFNRSSISYDYVGFKKEEEAIEYYNLLVKEGIEYKKRSIAALNSDIEKYEKFLYIDGKPQVAEKKSVKSNIVI